jgi:hypothetical protein
VADHSGTATVTWGTLTVTADGSDTKAGVVDLNWGAFTVTVDTDPRDHSGLVACAWGE